MLHVQDFKSPGPVSNSLADEASYPLHADCSIGKVVAECDCFSRILLQAHFADGYFGPAGDTVNEAELRGLFANAAGFRQLKLIRGNKSTTCFVEFSDIPTAMACHAAQQVASSLDFLDSPLKSV